MNSSITNVTEGIKRTWTTTFSDNKNILIVLLSVLLILSIIGVHVFHWVVEAIERLVDRVIELTTAIVRGVSYSAGEVINISSDTLTDVAKTTLDLGNGAVNDIGNVLKSGAYGNYVTPPVVVHGKSPAFLRPAVTPKKASKSPHPDGDHDGSSHQETMQTMWSPYVFTKPTGYSLLTHSYGAPTFRPAAAAAAAAVAN